MIQKSQLQKNFSAASTHYESQAGLQQRWRSQVLNEAAMRFPDHARILDIGCGTGAFSREALIKRPHWQMIGLDLAFGMCQQARAHGSAIQADAVMLPLADDSFDAVVSSLCLQWVEDIGSAFHEISRVLRPGGQSIIMTLTQGTLDELHKLAPQLRLLPMRSEQEYAEAAGQDGLLIEQREAETETHAYASLGDLLHSFKTIGAQAASGRPQPMTPGQYSALAQRYAERYGNGEGGVIATWRPLLMVLRKPGTA